MNLMGKPPLGQKVKPIRGTPEAKAHMARVASMRCIVCLAPGPSEVHHVIHGRYGQRKSSDFETIPLCFECHRGKHGIHADKTAWADRNGFDYEFLAVVADILAGELNE